MSCSSSTSSAAPRCPRDGRRRARGPCTGARGTLLRARPRGEHRRSRGDPRAEPRGRCPVGRRAGHGPARPRADAPAIRDRDAAGHAPGDGLGGATRAAPRTPVAPEPGGHGDARDRRVPPAGDQGRDRVHPRRRLRGGPRTPDRAAPDRRGRAPGHSRASAPLRHHAPVPPARRARADRRSAAGGRDARCSPTSSERHPARAAEPLSRAPRRRLATRRRHAHRRRPGHGQRRACLRRHRGRSVDRSRERRRPSHPGARSFRHDRPQQTGRCRDHAE